tara:strand:+ start:288 stop:1298 length:1011 start_codon:yes stop_codon:yes gene_type:complete
MIGVGCGSPSGGGGGATPTLSVGVFSDAGHTTPVTTASFGDSIYIKATVAGITATTYYLYIDNGNNSILPVTNGTGEFTYNVNLSVTLSIAMIATDAANGVADSEPFALTVIGVYPPDISGNVLWVDAERASTYSLNGALVAQLNDLSGLSNHLPAPTVGNQPTYLDFPSGINSLRSTQFASGKFLNKLGLSLDIVTGNSIFIVANFTTSTTGGLISNGNSTTDGTSYLNLQQNGLGIRTFNQSVGLSSTHTIALNTNYLFEVHRTPTTERFFINGVLKHSITISTSGGRDNLYLNSAYNAQPSPLTGDIAVFNTVISGTEETDLRSYLMTKWNIV